MPTNSVLGFQSEMDEHKRQKYASPCMYAYTRILDAHVSPSELLDSDTIPRRPGIFTNAYIIKLYF